LAELERSARRFILFFPSCLIWALTVVEFDLLHCRKKQLSALRLMCSAFPRFLQDIFVDTNRVFYHASCGKPLLHLAPACFAEIFSESFIVNEPQHGDGEFLAIWLHG
jgi:hypothetical protein